MEAQIKGVTFRKDLETNPVQQLGEFLKLVGLEHTKSRKQNAPEGKRITFYKITQESLDMMVALEMLHKDPVSPWIEINERYGFVDEEYWQVWHPNRQFDWRLEGVFHPQPLKGGVWSAGIALGFFIHY